MDSSPMLNLYCSHCRHSSPTCFCVCSVDQDVFCFACFAEHVAQPASLPHLALPVAGRPLSAEEEQVWRGRARDKAAAEAQIKQWKDAFATRAQDFQRQFHQFRLKSEAAFDTLQQSFADSVQEVVKYSKTPISDPNNVGKLQKSLFEPFMERLKQENADIQGKCGGLVEDWKGIYERDDFESQNSENPSNLCEKLQFHLSKSIFKGKKQPLLAILGLIMAFFAYYCLQSAELPADLYFPHTKTRSLLSQLGPYSLSPPPTGLISLNRPIHLELGDYKGQWSPTAYLSNVPEEERINGYGVIAYRSGDIYEGTWKKGKRHGNGRFLSTKGTVWEGIWTEDEFTGWGKCVFANGTVRSGHWRNWALEGFGEVNERKKQRLGGFKAGNLQGLGLRYVSESEFSLGTWDSGQLAGPGLEFSNNSVRWGDYPSGPFHSYPLPKSAEVLISRFASSNSNWEIQPEEVAAISFKTSTPAFLTAIGVGHSCNSTAKATIKKISIFQSQATEGPLVYDHGRKETLHSAGESNGRFSVIRLNQRVALESSVDYTLRVAYDEGVQIFYGKAAVNHVEEAGLRVRFVRANYEGDDIEQFDHEWTSPLKNFYFNLD